MNLNAPSLKVLFIDDEPDLCEIFVDTFSTPDLSIDAFTNPALAVEACKNRHYDVGFIDFRMPNINGDQLAQKINQNFPIYLVTGESDPKPTFKFSGILPKPFDCTKIENILTTLKTTTQ